MSDKYGNQKARQNLLAQSVLLILNTTLQTKL